ncbi:hypothetical protein ABT381_11465 [Streptomyces sp. NPDC000151]|uniref:hypothetical protein n=1 Tax=Streptomyces sp. NPDC000151 TaxID=3154244 RepID=UPI00331E602F
MSVLPQVLASAVRPETGLTELLGSDVIVARRRTLSIFSARSPVVVMALVFLGVYLETSHAKSWGIQGLPATVVGGLGSVYTVWCWLGRTRQARSWAVIDRGPQLALIGIPLFAFVMLGGGIYYLFGLPKLVVLPFAFISALHFLVLLAGFFGLPKWWGPRWFRRGEYKKDFKGAQPQGALGTLVDSCAAQTPTLLSQEEIGKRFGDVSEPVAQWKGGWVHDPDTDEQGHGLARKGTVEGKLAWYPQGLGFAATKQEDSLRQKPTVVTIPAGQLTGVEVVPARAGADGRRRPGFWMRSPFPRLVVRTASGAYVFDVARGRARKVAAFIRERTGQHA